MKILIGSDAPPALYKQADISSWTQRLIWFVEEGDTIVLNSKPDSFFVEYVTKFLGINPSKLNFVTVPSRWEKGNFDAWALLNGDFLKELLQYVVLCEEIVTLWPSTEVGWLAKLLDSEQKLPGAKFLMAGGGALSNSKTFFRVLAGGLGINIPIGGVCYSADDAVYISRYAIKQSSAFVVKQNYGGGGQGNEIVSVADFSVSHSGHSSLEIVAGDLESLDAYWTRRWNWASVGGTNPCVIESYIENARTLYIEFNCTAEGISEGKIGEIKFENGRMFQEIFPAQNVTSEVRKNLERNGKLLADAYFQIGYRGPISIDSVVTTNNEVFFTEANARYTSSTHLYSSIGEKIVGVDNTTKRIVMQTVTDAAWEIESFRGFVELLEDKKLAFDSQSRCGILAVTPLIGNLGQIMLAIVAETEAVANEFFKNLNSAFVELNKLRWST